MKTAACSRSRDLEAQGFKIAAVHPAILELRGFQISIKN
jgi:hypothetical protein